MTHDIASWTYGSDHSDIDVYPGDTVSVTWTGTHTFNQFPTDATILCNDFSTSTNLAVGTSASWFVDAAFAGHRVGFACSIGAHCQSGGMMFYAHVQTPTHSVTWGASGTAKPAIDNVGMGDSLIFEYTGTSEDVNMFRNQTAFDACDFTQSDVVCTGEGPCTHVFATVAKGKSVYFGSSGGDGACGGNRKVEVKFSAASTVAASLFSLVLGVAVFITNKRF